MDMYQKRKIRAEKKKDDSPKSFPSVGINWYPGHMAKTKREITEKIDLIDIVFEVVDARIPYSSKNKEIEEMTKGKPRVIVMTKIDLCDNVKTNKWIKYYVKKDINKFVITLEDNAGGIKDDIMDILKKLTFFSDFNALPEPSPSQPKKQ